MPVIIIGLIIFCGLAGIIFWVSNAQTENTQQQTENTQQQTISNQRTTWGNIGTPARGWQNFVDSIRRTENLGGHGKSFTILQTAETVEGIYNQESYEKFITIAHAARDIGDARTYYRIVFWSDDKEMNNWEITNIGGSDDRQASIEFNNSVGGTWNGFKSN